MDIFVELSLIVVLATLVSFLMKFLRQPLIVGYIATGVVVGPYALNLLRSQDELELFSKIGVSILLFIVGLTLNPDIAREVGKISVLTGLGQVIFTSVVGYFIAIGLGFSVSASLYIAIALTFSSTIIILKLLTDRGDTGKLYGKISIGFLLVQDIFATFALLAVTVMGTSAVGGVEDIASSAGFEVLKLLGLGLALVVALYLVSRYALPRLYALVGGNQEVLFIFSMAWGLGLASLFHVIGFSLEIGALLAGIMLSVSPFAYEIGSRMKPLRDFFILIFFILLGAQMVLADFGTILVPALIFSAFVLVGNPLIVFLILNIMGYRNRTAFMAGLTVAQISEFSLILVALGASLGHIGQETVSLVTLVGIITIAASTYLILYADPIYDKLVKVLRVIAPRKKPHKESRSDAVYPDIIIFGYHRVGHYFVDAARKVSENFLVVDYSPSVVAKLGERAVPHRYGDAEDVEFLEEIGFHAARLVVSSIPDHKTNLLLVRYYRKVNANGIIMVISHNSAEARELYEAGASYVVMPHYIGARHAALTMERHRFDSAGFGRERDLHLSALHENEGL